MAKICSESHKKWQEFLGRVCVHATFNAPNMLLSLCNRNTDRLFLIYGVDFVRIENPYERRRRPKIRSTQINPFFRRHRIFFARRSCRCFGCRSFIHSFDRNNATIYLFPFKSSVLQPNKHDSYRFGQKGNRSCHGKRDSRFVLLVRAFVFISCLAQNVCTWKREWKRSVRVCFFHSVSFRKLSSHTERDEKEKRKVPRH